MHRTHLICTQGCNQRILSTLHVRVVYIFFRKSFQPVRIFEGKEAQQKNTSAGGACAASTSALSTLMMCLEICTGDMLALNIGRRTWQATKMVFSRIMDGRGEQETGWNRMKQVDQVFFPAFNFLTSSPTKPLQRSLSCYHLRINGPCPLPWSRLQVCFPKGPKNHSSKFATYSWH